MLIPKVLSIFNHFNPPSGPVKLMFRPTWEGFMREFKLNSNNKHVATDWGLHVDLTVRADALHKPNVSLL